MWKTSSSLKLLLEWGAGPSNGELDQGFGAGNSFEKYLLLINWKTNTKKVELIIAPYANNPS